MKKKLLVLLLYLSMFLSASTVAQNATIQFGYDANGNRIVRSLEIRSMRSNDFLSGEFCNDSVFSDEQPQVLLFKATVTVYPNPTQDKFTIKQSDYNANPITAYLYTASGNLVEWRNIKSRQEEFDLGDKPSGVYFLHLSSKDERHTWKVVKK